jgi:hypothetical protein
MISTPGFSAADPTNGPGLYAMPNSPPLEVPQSINLDYFYEDAIHYSYRKYGLSLIELALH